MKIIKRLTGTGILTVLLALFSILPAFAEITPEMEVQYRSFAESIMSEMASYSEEDIDGLITTYETYGMTEAVNGFNQWKQIGLDAGEFVSIDAFQVTENDDGTQAMNLTAAYTNKKIDAVLTLDGSGYISGLEFSLPSENTSLGQKLKEASVNLIVGMGTVFAVLIFLCWVISLFGNINKLEKKFRANKVKEEIAETKKDILTLEKTTDDNELQAVIAAAIAAYESDCSGGIDKQPTLQNGISIKTYRRD